MKLIKSDLILISGMAREINKSNRFDSKWKSNAGIYFSFMLYHSIHSESKKRLDVIGLIVLERITVTLPYAILVTECIILSLRLSKEVRT